MAELSPAWLRIRKAPHRLTNREFKAKEAYFRIRPGLKNKMILFDLIKIELRFFLPRKHEAERSN
ncbi:MAG: hypothetical protein EA391_14385 [Balneolaceae bacterium]|nr:MAG: hypothetical protein EA391_14385 [Balneolaceae bacterium]